ncbi:hypothetical protein IJ670_05605 [bacterium]|nr:hypothetical protein [bacterium]
MNAEQKTELIKNMVEYLLKACETQPDTKLSEVEFVIKELQRIIEL